MNRRQVSAFRGTLEKAAGSRWESIIHTENMMACK